MVWRENSFGYLIRERMLFPILAVLASIISLCVGSSYAKTLFSQIGPEGATALRVGFAALILIVVWRPWRLPLSLADARAIGLYGVTLGAMNLCFYMAISRIPIGVAIAIEFIGPLALAIYSSRRAMDFVWIAFAVLGLAFLIPFKPGARSLDPLGVIYVFGAAICWALYIIFGQRAGKGHAGQVTSLGMSIAALLVVPLGAMRAGGGLLNSSVLLLGLLVALLSSAIPYSLEMYALRHLPKQTFGILLSLEPAVGAIAGWVILNEILSPSQCFAISCIIVASIGSTIGLRRANATSLADLDGISANCE